MTLSAAAVVLLLPLVWVWATVVADCAATVFDVDPPVGPPPAHRIRPRLERTQALLDQAAAARRRPYGQEPPRWTM